MAKKIQALIETFPDPLVTKFYVDAEGNYLGGYTEGNPAIPEGAIEVEAPPEHADDKWVVVSDVGSWVINPGRIIDQLKSELDSLERNAIMPRGAREAFIVICEQQAAAAHITKEQAYAQNPFYKGLRDTDQAASALRTLIRNLS